MNRRDFLKGFFASGITLGFYDLSFGSAPYQAKYRPLKIKVIGVGGCGCNVINTMITSDIKGYEYIFIDTDQETIDASASPLKIQIGTDLTKGFGACAIPAIGRKAALKEKDLLASYIKGADIVIIATGMGGGTGTGVSPVMASLSKGIGILTAGVVTKPFRFEGEKRVLNAEEGIEQLIKHSDVLVINPLNEIGIQQGRDASLLEIFISASYIQSENIKHVSDLMIKRRLCFQNKRMIKYERGG